MSSSSGPSTDLQAPEFQANPFVGSNIGFLSNIGQGLLGS